MRLRYPFRKILVAFCAWIFLIVTFSARQQNPRPATNVHANIVVSSAGCTVTSDGSQSDTQTKVNAAANGNVICLPAGTFTWTSGISVPSGIGITIQGAGNGGDSHNSCGSGTTTIIDNYTGGGNTNLIHFNPTMSSSLTRLTCLVMSPQSGLSANSLRAPIAFQGTCTSSGCPEVRLDHVVFPGSPGWQGLTADSATLVLSDNVYGVLDHNSLYFSVSGSGYYEFLNFNHSAIQGSGQYGDKSWTLATNYGSRQAIFIEDNYIEQTSDSAIFPISEQEAGFSATAQGGGRLVARYNTAIGPRSLFVNHGTESGGRVRGGRSMEIYRNTLDCPSATYVACWTNGILKISGPRSGGLYTFLNAITGKAANYIADIAEYRTLESIGAFGPCDGSGSWDQNDGITYWTGTIASVTGSNPYTITVTNGGGTSNPTPWTVNQWVSNGSPYSMHDSTVNSGSEITANAASTVTVTKWTGTFPYTAGDSIQILRATKCIDQSGLGPATVLLSGNPATPTGWVNEPIEPVYQAGDTSAAGLSFGVFNANTARIIANRDYYAEVSQTAQTSTTSPFNGTTGTGYGLLANIPTTCTTGAGGITGVGYFATDTNGLYLCTATNVWNWTYSPFTYPHPILGQLPVNNYSTKFLLTENPIAEPIVGQSSVWTGGTVASSSLWGDVQTNGTMVYGVHQPTLFGDPTAILKGTWGATQGGQATVKITSTPTSDSEVEIRLRSTVTTNSITGYEIYCNTRPGNPYCHIATWGGPNGCYDNFEPSTPAIALVNGDTLSATVSGTGTVTIKLYVNGILKATAIDSGTHTSEGGAACQGAGGASFSWGVWNSGNPGIGFWSAVDNAWTNFGFSKFSVFGQ